MPDRTQTLSVELTQDEIEALLREPEECRHDHGPHRDGPCYGCTLFDAQKKLRAVSLSQPEHQGDGREQLRELAEDLESQAGQAFKQCHPAIPTTPAEGEAKGEGEGFATAANAIRELLDAMPAQPPAPALSDEVAQRVVVDFLTDWRFCPVSTAANPSRSCLEDAAKQLLDALASREQRGEEKSGHITLPSWWPTPQLSRCAVEEVLGELQRMAVEADPTLALKALARGDNLSRRYHEGTATGLNRAIRLLRTAVNAQPPPGKVEHAGPKTAATRKDVAMISVTDQVEETFRLVGRIPDLSSGKGWLNIWASPDGCRFIALSGHTGEVEGLWEQLLTDAAIKRIADSILRDFGLSFADCAGDRDRVFWHSAYAPEREAVRRAIERELSHVSG